MLIKVLLCHQFIDNEKAGDKLPLFEVTTKF